MIEQISSYLQRIGVEHGIDKKHHALYFDVSTSKGTWQCLILVCQNKDMRNGLGFYSTLPIRVPQLLRNQMAMFLMCLNNDRILGNFELDPETGDLHFKTYIDFDHNGFSEKAVERNMMINISIMQEHLPKLTKMIKCA
jgi:hypothetical protein